MPWCRVEDISDYRINTENIDAWLKGKWGDYDYQIQYDNGLYSFWSLEPKSKALLDEIEEKVRWKLG